MILIPLQPDPVINHARQFSDDTNLYTILSEFLARIPRL